MNITQNPENLIEQQEVLPQAEFMLNEFSTTTAETGVAYVPNPTCPYGCPSDWCGLSSIAVLSPIAAIVAYRILKRI